MDDQRQNPRIGLEIDVEINMSREQGWFSANTRNISCSGICLITRTSLLSSPVLDLKFRLPDSTRIIKITGEIIWQEYMVDKDYIATGIMFKDIKPMDIELINKYIENATFIIRD